MTGPAVQVELARIIINEQSPEQVIVLREAGGTRQFPIVIGIFEAWAIDRKVKDVDVPRPMTHDLLANVIGELGGELKQVLINDIEGGTFYARLIVGQGGRDHSIDCRPSDAVALAVRVGVPIFVEAVVFEKLASG
jgi:bifunctional DNase/RNase